MSNVRRVYVEKKGSYDVQQKALAHEIRNYLGIKDVEYVRILNRYDVENVSDETFERACNGIFAEPPVDVLWKEEAPVGSGDSLFSVEFLPGQFDQRADSAVQCIQFVKEDEQPVIRTATTYIIHGKNGAITEEELQKIDKLFDIALCYNGAYQETEVSCRSYDKYKEERDKKSDIQELCDEILAME